MVSRFTSLGSSGGMSPSASSLIIARMRVTAMWPMASKSSFTVVSAARKKGASLTSPKTHHADLARYVAPGLVHGLDHSQREEVVRGKDGRDLRPCGEFAADAVSLGG